jgi:hypothetical protein
MKEILPWWDDEVKKPTLSYMYDDSEVTGNLANGGRSAL